MRAGITEVDQEAVADIPGYKASKRVDGRGNGFVVVGDQVSVVATAALVSRRLVFTAC
jgi:hypothetical protein